jgi:predicted ester cyclase
VRTRRVTLALAGPDYGRGGWYIGRARGDIEMTFGDLIAENDQVVIPWKSSGIHQGEFAGVAPSGKRVTFEGLALLRIADGKIVEDVAYGDTFEVIHNLEA